MATKKKESSTKAPVDSIFTAKQQEGIQAFSSLLKQNKTVLKAFRDDMADQVREEYAKMKRTKKYMNLNDLHQVGVYAANQTILNLETLGNMPPAVQQKAAEPAVERAAKKAAKKGDK